MQKKARGAQKGYCTIKNAAQQLWHTRHDWLEVDKGEAELALCKHLARVYGVRPIAVVLQTATSQGVGVLLMLIQFLKKLSTKLSEKQRRV